MIGKQKAFILKVILIAAAVLFWILAAAVPAYAAGIPVYFDESEEDIPRGGLYIVKEGKVTFEFTVDEGNGLKVYRNRVLADLSVIQPGEEREYTEPYTVKALNFARDLKGGYLDMIIRCRKLKIVCGTVKKEVTPSSSADEENDGRLTLLAMSKGSAVAQAFSVFSAPERYGYGAEQILEISFRYHDTGELYTEGINYCFTDLDQGDYIDMKRQFFTSKRGYMETISLDEGFSAVHVMMPEDQWLLRILGDAVFIPTATDSNTLRSGFIAEGSGAVTITWTGSECGTEMVDLFENRGGIRITKVSERPELTEGNDCYSLKGAVFGIYEDPDCTAEIMTLETDENGIAYSGFEFSPGTYYVKEVAAPEGFVLSGAVFMAEVENGTMADITAADEPFYAKAGRLFRKTDRITGTVPQGDAQLSGAEYCVRVYGTEDMTGDALAEAVFRTDGDGCLDLSGEPAEVAWPWKDGDGNNILPLGYISVTEKTAPAGYAEGDEQYVYTVTEKDGEVLVEHVSGNKAGDGGEILYLEDIGIYGGISVMKLDGHIGSPVPGAVFSVVNDSENPVSVAGKLYDRGEEILVFITDDSGTAASDAVLPYGTYRITEKEAPSPWIADEDFSGTVYVREDGSIMPSGICINYQVPFEHGDLVTSYKSSDPEPGSRVETGDVIKYTVTTVNTGAGTAENIRVRDPIPLGTEYVEGSVSGNGVYVAAADTAEGTAYVEWTYDKLDSLESASTEFSVKVSEDPPKYIENIAYTAADPEPVMPGDPEAPAPSKETDTVWHRTGDETAPCVVKAVLSSDPLPGTTVSPGDVIVYHITLQNTGDDAVKNVAVFDAIPEDTQYEAGAADCGGEYCGSGVGWLVEELGPGGSKVLSFAVKV
ncbi:MAG: DUF11 domain-containing protein, partial [Lachnospiraceae bacterium]|nr:DUF11 domain-containing protein [Lachnospiraceae bacterium]